MRVRNEFFLGWVNKARRKKTKQKKEHASKMKHKAQREKKKLEAAIDNRC